MATTTPATDTELFDALRGGKSAALDELFRRYYVDLCRTAVRFVMDETTAEDIVQEVFTGLWTKRAKLPSDTQAVGPYLRRAVRNRSLNYLRDRKRIPVDDGEMPDITADAAQEPGMGMERAETQQRITRAIDRLPERCRLVFVMSKVENMSNREIAEGLDISVKTVENQMTRAYKFLREWLALLLPFIFCCLCLI
ncbi:RNA polymerase sigma-70 factor [Neolewinella litorea]|uniref:RNA polymerase sigma-70 factor n=1 Tax=Neolewinella litorea TaxID=2562452 RepID=A0A4V6S269_9BACT|nr:RNA polymerase sigma-70 factor [Neolewinella litorea]THH41553.1 RNA polymerase sigma-70 factor [Neolewinella litorea]